MYVHVQVMRRHELIVEDALQMKPENVLLADAKGQSSKVRIVDFGNAIHPADASAYFDDFNLQSMFYRAPEVLFGMRDFTFPIDMWSLGNEYDSVLSWVRSCS